MGPILAANSYSAQSAIKFSRNPRTWWGTETVSDEVTRLRSMKPGTSSYKEQVQLVAAMHRNRGLPLPTKNLDPKAQNAVREASHRLSF
jgi:hypothetical protein